MALYPSWLLGLRVHKLRTYSAEKPPAFEAEGFGLLPARSEGS